MRELKLQQVVQDAVELQDLLSQRSETPEILKIDWWAGEEESDEDGRWEDAAVRQ